MDVFDLVAKISLDQSEYDKGLGDAEKSFEGFGGKLKKGLGTAAKVGGAVITAVGAAGVALTKTVIDGASQVASYGDNIDKMSQKMGISAQAYQEWDAILQHSGTSIDGMQRGMMTLSSAVEKGSDAFQKLGISQEQVASMSQEDLFAEVIKGLQGMEEGSARTALAQQLLGGAAKELGPLLNTSAEDTEAMRQRVHELGGVMSDEAVKAAAAYSDSLQDMKTGFEGLKRGLFTEFMPGITEVMDGLTEIFAGNSDKGVGMISKGIESLADKINKAMPQLIEIGGKILKALGRAILDNLPEIFKMGTTILVQLVTGLIEALPELVAAIPEIFTAMGEAFEENWPALREAGIQLLKVMWEGIQSALGWLGEQVNSVTDTIKNSLSEKWGAIKSDVSSKWDGIKTNAVTVWNAVKTTAVTVSAAAGSALSEAWETAKANVQDKVEALKSAISEKFDAMKNKVTAFVTSVKSKLEEFKNKVQNVVDKIKALFNFNFSTPHIKLPHFTITPAGWKIGDLLQGIKPELSISWYAKAYDNPYVFTKPTLMGFGDGNGGEMVYGRDNLMNDIRNAMDDGTGNRIDYIIALLENIIQNGLNANVREGQIYRSVARENLIRTKATNYNLLSAR